LTADFTKGKDIIVVNKDRQIAEAKKHALMAEAGIHNQPQNGCAHLSIGYVLSGTDQMEAGKYISEHDKKIANKLALCNGWW
jgi:3-hydroxyacyl-CoA dehydrogenase